MRIWLLIVIIIPPFPIFIIYILTCRHEGSGALNNTADLCKPLNVTEKPRTGLLKLAARQKQTVGTSSS